MLKQNLQQKLLQKLSPQHIQMIKLLELPTLQLEQKIKKELEENPALEEGNEENQEYNQENEENQDNENQDEFSLEDYVDDDDIPEYRLNTNNYSKDDDNVFAPQSSYKSLQEFIKEQISLKNITDKQFFIADFIIGNIDEDGYLRRELESISDDIMFSKNISISEEELKNVLDIIQQVDPAGIGARNLQECLLIQLNRKKNTSEELTIAKKIIQNNFNEFTKKHYKKIIDRYSISEAKLKEVLDIIIKLNPKPGSSYTEGQITQIQSIIPDFIVEITDGEIQISLNSGNIPEIKINKTYADMLQASVNKSKKSSKDAEVFIKQKLDSAKWFIEAIKQRQNTLLFTINAIVGFQKDFFLEGDETKLKPMILKDIAKKTNLDISTISRVANSKYVQTPYGNYPLKYFFSEKMQKDCGEEVSTRQIKAILKECIDKEPKSKPLTDEKLSSILKEKGYKVARRTIAKYREQLGIPVARLRKEL